MMLWKHSKYNVPAAHDGAVCSFVTARYCCVGSTSGTADQDAAGSVERSTACGTIAATTATVVMVCALAREYSTLRVSAIPHFSEFRAIPLSSIFTFIPATSVLIV